MSLTDDIARLQTELTAAIDAAADEAALEAVRVAAFGKKGSVSALLGTLGSTPPEERKSARPRDQRAEARDCRGDRAQVDRAQGRGARGAAQVRAGRRHAARGQGPDGA